MNTHKLTRLAMLLALGLVLSYLEFLLPFNYSIPGIKLGLANMVTMLVMYQYSVREAAAILFLRVVLSGLMFSGLNTIVFGIAGGVLCIIAMALAKRSSIFSVMGVSMLGAVFHNVGQLMIAFIIMQNVDIIYYFPYLLIYIPI